MSELTVPMRLTLVAPPAGVRFCLQRGARDLVDVVTAEAGGDLEFRFTVRAQPSMLTDSVRFLGEFVQGPPKARFVYIRIGQMAGQFGTPWSRRAKIPLSGITWSLVDKACRAPNQGLEASYHGTGRDGGPACATIHLIGDGWQVARR